MRLFRALSLLLLVSSYGLAATPDRIAGAIDSSRMVQLARSLHPKAQPQYDQGAVDPQFQFSYVTLLISPSASQQRALDKLLADQQDPASPNYHKWLTPEQYGERFGLSQNDLNKITAWLKAQGFTVLSVGGGHNSIVFSGTAAQVEAAFQTQIHHYNVGGEMHLANSTPAKVPAAFSGLITGVRGLNDFRPKPMGVRRRPRPDYYDSDFNFNFLAPGDLKTIYDLKPFYDAGIDGTGQKLAIAGQTDILLADLNDFFNAFGLPAISGCTVATSGVITACSSGGNFSYVVVGTDPGVPFTGDLAESDLDIEMARAVARGAQIVFVTAPSATGSVFDAVAAAINPPVGPPLAPVITVSYGDCEALFGPSLETELQQANAEGVTVLNSTGDTSSAGCDGFTNSTTPPNLATGGLAVSYPASSPEVTGVGGTAVPFLDLTTNAGTYWATSTSGNGSDGGSALGPVPEEAWNDLAEFAAYCAANTSNTFCTQGGSTPVPGWVSITSPLAAQEDLGIGGGGGGASNCFTKTTGGVCQAGFPQPTWQQGLRVTGAPAGVRYVPDISLLSTPNWPGYIFCTPIEELVNFDPTNVYINDFNSSCQNGIAAAVLGVATTSVDTTIPPSLIGGTSTAAPAFAAMVTLLNQYFQRTSPGGLGNINPMLYKLAAVPSNKAFHQITDSGSNNVVACVGGTPSGQPASLQCPGTVGSVQSMGFQASNFDSTTGYNLVTGLGSIDLNRLATAWAAAATPGFVQVPGELVQITVGGQGSVWGLTSAGQIYNYNTATQTWVPIGGILAQIAAAPDGAVWGINSAHQVFTYNTQTQSWNQVPGLLTQIAVGSAGVVWGISATQQVFRYNPGTQGFDLIPGTLAQIAVASDGSVWGLNAAQQIFTFNPYTQSWNPVPGSLTQIAVGSANAVWGLNAQQQTFHFNPQTQGWDQIPGTISQIIVGANGAVWGLNSSQQIFTFDPQTQGWNQIPGTLSQIAAGNDGSVWGVNAAQQIFKLNVAPSVDRTWEQISGQLTQVAVGADGAVWGINSAQQIFTFNGQTQSWHQVPGSLTQIAVGFGGTAWGINAAQNIYAFNPQTQSWHQIPGSLTQIAVGADGTVWGINSAQQIFTFNAQTQSWHQVPGSLTQIAVGSASAVWGINAQQQIYQYNPQTQGWNRISGQLTQIGVAFDGTVWGVNSAQEIYAFDRQTQGWDRIFGLLTEIAVGSDGAVWGLNSAQQIFRLQ